MKKYRKKNENGEHVEAVRFDGNDNEIVGWVESICGDHSVVLIRVASAGMTQPTADDDFDWRDLVVLEGYENRYAAAKGDWIVKDSKGEFSVVMGEVFDKLYEEVRS